MVWISSFSYVTRSLHALAKIFEYVCQLRTKIYEGDILILSRHLYPRHFIAFHKGKKNMFTTCSRGVQPGSSGLSLNNVLMAQHFQGPPGETVVPSVTRLCFTSNTDYAKWLLPATTNTWFTFLAYPPITNGDDLEVGSAFVGTCDPQSSRFSKYVLFWRGPFVA